MAKNPVTWWEIQVPDLDEGVRFFGGVFGWTFTDWQEGYKAIHHPDGTMIGGLNLRDGDAAGRHIHVVFDLDPEEGQSGDTLEQVLARIEAHGGKIARPRTQISAEMGWYATAQDPTGLTFDVWTGRPEA